MTNEEQEENETGRDSPDISTSSNHSTNASITPSLTHNLVSSTATCTDWSRSRQLRTSMSDLLDIPGLPCALPPRSPTFGRRRTSRYEPPSPSSMSPSRLPRSYMPSFSSTEDFTSARYELVHIITISFYQCFFHSKCSFQLNFSPLHTSCQLHSDHSM